MRLCYSPKEKNALPSRIPLTSLCQSGDLVTKRCNDPSIKEIFNDQGFHEQCSLLICLCRGPLSIPSLMDRSGELFGDEDVFERASGSLIERGLIRISSFSKRYDNVHYELTDLGMKALELNVDSQNTKTFWLAHSLMFGSD